MAARAVASAVADASAMTAQCLTDSNCALVRSSTGVRCQAAATRNIGFLARASATRRLASATSLSDARMSGAGSTAVRLLCAGVRPDGFGLDRAAAIPRAMLPRARPAGGSCLQSRQPVNFRAMAPRRRDVGLEPGDLLRPPV